MRKKIAAVISGAMLAFGLGILHSPPVFAESIDGELTHDEIRTVSANVLKIISAPTSQIDAPEQRIKKLEEENARVNAELAEFKRRHQNASQTERAEINTAIKRNEKQLTALKYAKQGASFFDKREYKKAVEALNKAIEIDPEYSNAWAWLGWVYNELGNTDKAIECTKKAIELDPNNELTWNNLGDTYLYLGDLDKSIEYYLKATQLDPKFFYP